MVFNSFGAFATNCLLFASLGLHVESRYTTRRTMLLIPFAGVGGNFFDASFGGAPCFDDLDTVGCCSRRALCCCLCCACSARRAVKIPAACSLPVQVDDGRKQGGWLVRVSLLQWPGMLCSAGQGPVLRCMFARTSAGWSPQGLA